MISIVVVNWNGRDYLDRCLASIEKDAPSRRHPTEVLVVDNGSTDGSVELVRSRYPGVTLIAHPENLGYPKALNAGLKQAKGTFPVILNNDTQFLPGALDAMADVMEKDPTIGVLAPRLVNPDGSLQVSINLTYPGLASLFFSSTGLTAVAYRIRRSPYLKRLMEPYYRWLHGRFRPIAWAAGACLMTRREALQAVGMLDETIFLYQEDADWCCRMNRQGWRVVYTPDASVMHHWGTDSKRANAAQLTRYYLSQWHYYQKYHRGPLLTLCSLIFKTGLWLRLSYCRIRALSNSDPSVTERLTAYKSALSQI